MQVSVHQPSSRLKKSAHFHLTGFYACKTCPRTLCALPLGKQQNKVSPGCTSWWPPWVQTMQEKYFLCLWDTWREGGVREGGVREREGNLLACRAVQDEHICWKQRTAGHEFPLPLPWQLCSSLGWWSYSLSRGMLLQWGSSPLRITSSPTCLLWSLILLSIYTVVNQD